METRAAIAHKPGDPLTIETVNLEGPKEGEVLVEIKATGVCHTDLKSAGAGSPVPKPTVLGHEGTGVTKLAPGDPVVMTFDSCGACPSGDTVRAGTRRIIPYAWGHSPGCSLEGTGSQR